MQTSLLFDVPAAPAEIPFIASRARRIPQKQPEKILQIVWHSKVEYRQPGDFDEKMLVPVAPAKGGRNSGNEKKTDILPLPLALNQVLNGMIATLRDNGRSPDFVDIATNSAIEAGKKGFELFVSFAASGDAKRYQVRACEIWNNFCHAVEMLLEGAVLRVGQLDARGEVEARTILFDFDTSLCGLIRHRADKEGMVEMHDDYRTMTSVRQGGDLDEAELTQDHIRQIFRFTPGEMEERRSNALAFLREHMGAIRRL